MAYAFTTKRKPEPKQATWKWDAEIRMAEEIRAKEVSDAARRFRKNISK